jgi:adenine-specific DNA-methyltransferase
MVKKSSTKTVETLKHDEAKRKNIPTAEFQSVLKQEEQNPVRLAYERRNRDLDLVVHAPPLYIQEKVHPKALIDDLLRETKEPERHISKQGWQSFRRAGTLVLANLQ